MMNENRENLQIYGIIRKIEQTIEESPKAKLGGAGKRIVDVEILFDLLGDLKVSVPDDIRRANNILSEADTVLFAADERARVVIDGAERRASLTIDKATAKSERVLQESYDEFEKRVSGNQIYLEAQKRSRVIIKKAELNAETIIDDAKRFGDKLLGDIYANLSAYQRMVTESRQNFSIETRDPRPDDEGIQPTALQPEEKVNDGIYDDDLPENDLKEHKENIFTSFINRIKDRLSLQDDEDEEYLDIDEEPEKPENEQKQNPEN
ncbi:MAG: hypothetical protein RRY79_01885 [Clostridia bacterium]